MAKILSINDGVKLDPDSIYGGVFNMTWMDGNGTYTTKKGSVLLFCKPSNSCVYMAIAGAYENEIYQQIIANTAEVHAPTLSAKDGKVVITSNINWGYPLYILEF